MPRPKKITTEPIQESVEEVKIEEPKKTIFKVYGPNGFVREYSIEEHGENAEQMAKGFAGKYANHSVI